MIEGLPFQYQAMSHISEKGGEVARSWSPGQTLGEF
jgi:hypothetical protein